MSLAMRPNEVNTEVQYDCKVRLQAVIFFMREHSSSMRFCAKRFLLSVAACRWERIGKIALTRTVSPEKIGGNGGNSHLSVYLEIWVSKAVEMKFGDI